VFRYLVELSLKFRVLVAAGAIAVMVIGVAHLRTAPVDALPEFGVPMVQIQAEALGLSAAEVEQLITLPIEHDLLNGVPWLDQIRSESIPGLCSILLIFQPGTDPLKARQVVQERMTQAHALPNVGTSPVIVPPVSSLSRVMMIGLSSKELSMIDLSVLARWKIKPRLMGVPGVANVTIWGQRDKQLQVQVDPERLRANGVSLSQVISTTGNALWSSPLTFVEASTPGTGGFIDTSTQRLGIQHVSPITSPQGLASVTIEDTGTRKLRLDQVANVVEGHQPLIGDAVLAKGQGLLLVVEKFPGADTREITDGVEEALSALKPGLSGVDIDPDIYQARSFIDTALQNLGIWAIAGPGLLLVVLALVFFSWRPVVVGFASIVLSLIAAMFVLFVAGVPFNGMILAGLAVAVGLVINDALADLPVIRPKLAELPAASDSGTKVQVLGEVIASQRTIQLFATLVVLVAALPLLFLSGLANDFATPAVIAYMAAVVISTLVALTLAPTLAFFLLKNGPAKQRNSPLARPAGRLFDATVSAFLRQPRWAVALIGALLLALAAGLFQLGDGPQLPQTTDRSLLIHWEGAPGTSLPEMTQTTTTVINELRALHGVEKVGGHLGRAITSDQVVNVNKGEVWVTVADDADYNDTVAAVKSVLSKHPSVHSTLLTYPDDRIRAVESGAKEPVAVRVYGPDLQVLHRKADEIRQRISTVTGVVDAKVETIAEEPNLEVRVNLEKAQKYGINPGDVRRTAATYFSGLLAGNLYQEQKIFDVVVVGSPAMRQNVNSVANVLIDTSSGEAVRIGDIADIRLVPNPTVIRHDATLRALTITADIKGRDLGSVLNDVNDQVKAMPMPLEYHAELVGTASQLQTQTLQTIGLAIAALVGVLLLLQAALGSWRLAALVLVTLPLTAGGAVLAAFLVGGIMTVGALAGLLATVALTVRVILNLVHAYQEADSAAPGIEAVIATTRERAPVILLSTVATVAAFIPLFVLGSAAGTEIVRPLAVTLVGGLITSTLVTFFVLPFLYLRIPVLAAAPAPARLEAAPAPNQP
jgi:Cu/Ag efflux pump CusA